MAQNSIFRTSYMQEPLFLVGLICDTYLANKSALTTLRYRDKDKMWAANESYAPKMNIIDISFDSDSAFGSGKLAVKR